MNKYVITDIISYASDMRDCAAKFYKKNYTENLDDYITIKQIICIIYEKCITTNENNEPILNQNISDEILEIICDWIYGVALSKLAANDKLECAWDNEQNCMVFWNKNHDQHGVINEFKPKNHQSDDRNR